MENELLQNKSICHYLYLLREREFIKSKENIYKLGKTHQINLARFNSYPNGSQLLLHIICNDCDKLEKIIIKLFKIKYYQRKDIGTEYFEGDLFNMINDIYNEVIKMNSYKKNIENNEYKKEETFFYEVKEIKTELLKINAFNNFDTIDNVRNNIKNNITDNVSNNISNNITNNITNNIINNITNNITDNITNNITDNITNNITDNTLKLNEVNKEYFKSFNYISYPSSCNFLNDNKIKIQNVSSEEINKNEIHNNRLSYFNFKNINKNINKNKNKI